MPHKAQYRKSARRPPAAANPDRCDVAAGDDDADEFDQPLEIGKSGCQIQASSFGRPMVTHMADAEWKLLPTPMWHPGSMMADLAELILEVSFDEGVPSWKVQRRQGKNALPDLIAGGTAGSVDAAKAAALHVAETELRS
jgi:hypothetical protein